MIKPRIYLAGPGVFRADAQRFGAELKMMVKNFGMEGLWPLDSDGFQNAKTPIQRAHAICRHNYNLIEQCDGVLADISPFRGPNMDPGTAAEIGFANAICKPVFCWSSDLRSLLQRTLPAHPDSILNSREEWRDIEGGLIENFGLPENLMISCIVRGIYRSPGEALIAMSDVLLSGSRKLAQA